MICMLGDATLNNRKRWIIPLMNMIRPYDMLIDMYALNHGSLTLLASAQLGGAYSVQLVPLL